MLAYDAASLRIVGLGATINGNELIICSSLSYCEQSTSIIIIIKKKKITQIVIKIIYRIVAF